MRIILLSNYYHPETVGAGIWVTQLARDLQQRGHEVTVVTSLPSYPAGVIFGGYRNRWKQSEVFDGITVIRTYTYATPSKAFWSRVRSFGTFCLSSAVCYLPDRLAADVVYAIVPPLPLGVSAWAIAKASSARLVVNIQDIYPDIAAALGYLTNPAALWFFWRMERWIYRHADRVTVISEGFRENLEAKGVPPAKIRVITNWADPEAIAPSARDNAMRRELGLEGQFVVLYAGGLTHNATLEPVIEAAARLRDEPIRFVIAGEGVQKEALMNKATALGLHTVTFLPFQSLERYAQLLAAADLTVVTLNSAATLASVPSKIYKQMAAARPIVAITNPGNELTRLLEAGGCGVAVPPDDPQRLVSVFRRALAEQDAFIRMGVRGRAYLEQHCSRAKCVAAIEGVLSEV